MRRLRGKARDGNRMERLAFGLKQLLIGVTLTKTDSGVGAGMQSSSQCH